MDEDGEGVGLFASPMKELSTTIPWRPCVLPHLVPQQINMWMGNNKSGSSSGLHHDYHDNLYILLRGKKRFTLFSPAAIPAMKVHGDVDKVMHNGLITYHGGPSLRADGVSSEATAEELRVEAEVRLMAAQEVIESMRSGEEKTDAKRMELAVAGAEAAEQDIEDALEAMLNAAQFDEDEDDMADGEEGDADMQADEGKRTTAARL